MISIAECLCGECNICGAQIGYETTADEIVRVAEEAGWLVTTDDYYMICAECTGRMLVESNPKRGARLCDNFFYSIQQPVCHRGQATRAVHIIYSDPDPGTGWRDEDVLFVCDECASTLAKDARAHDYKVHVEDLTPEIEEATHGA